MSAGDIRPRCFDTPCGLFSREDSRERRRSRNNSARDRETDIYVLGREQEREKRSQIGKKRKKKVRETERNGRWTTKGRAWLERRDDGAGKERKKKDTPTIRKDGRERNSKGSEGRSEEARFSRPNELFGSGTKIIIEISCR